MPDFLPDITLKSVSRVENEPLLSLTFVLTNGNDRETRVLIIPENKYFELKLAKGNITAEVFDLVESEAKISSAIRRGAGILGYGANSEKSVIRKLRQRGFDPETSERAAAELKSCGYINEDDDALALARRCTAKFWGMRRILAHLYEKGYGSDTVASVRESFDSYDFADDCAVYIRKKYRIFPSEPKDKEKAVAALMRRGYTGSEIREALSRLSRSDKR